MPKGESLDAQSARLIRRVLVMYYQEERTQAEIAKITGQSVSTVNRLIRRGRELGMVEISIRPLFQFQQELERQLMVEGGLSDAIIVPTESDDAEVVLREVGLAAASVLVSTLRDGQTICISGGKGVSAVVEGLRPSRPYQVEVVPATGLVQGRHYIDVNHVASEMAGKLGGTAYQIHAPMFADSDEQRDMLRGVSAVADVLGRARSASIAVVGIGSVLAEGSSYLDFGFRSNSRADWQRVLASKAQGELLAHLLDEDGQLAHYPRNALLVGLVPEDLRGIPHAMGVASGPNKVRPIASVLRGRYLKSLVTDEKTAVAVLEVLQRQK